MRYIDDGDYVVIRDMDTMNADLDTAQKLKEKHPEWMTYQVTKVYQEGGFLRLFIYPVEWTRKGKKEQNR